LAKNGFQEGQMGITAKEVVDALKAAQNGTKVKGELAEVKHASDPEEEYDRTIAAKYRMCRVYQHAWDYMTAQRKKGEYVQGLVCIRCDIARSAPIDAFNGDRLGCGWLRLQRRAGLPTQAWTGH
jgi:hypothetical protein